MRTIWVNGCFDVLHIGHIGLLEYAKSLGDEVIVGIDSDKRVKELKGEDRPFNNQHDRANMLRAIKYVDAVFIFDNENQMEGLITLHGVDTMVVGDEYQDKRVVGSERVGEVKFFKKIDGYSTSNILKGLL